jgi:protein kinase
MTESVSKSAERVILPEYHISHQLSETAHSLIYRAIRKKNRQPVILKTPKTDHPKPEELIRYKQEFEIARRLSDAGVIPAYGLEPFHNSLVLIQEDFGGESLRHWLGVWKSVCPASFPLRQFLQLASRIAAELARVHAAGVIHKNINPSNIVFNPDTGELRLIDFDHATALSWETPLFKNPQVLEGTLAYLSPEQTGRMNRVVDYRSDLYSLGVTLYELLTGHLPFQSNDPLVLVHSHIAKTPQPVAALNTSVPPLVSDIVMKLLAKNAEDRYQSAFGLKADLEQCLAFSPGKQGARNIADLSFELGQEDYSGQLQIPQKLYGRTTETASLLEAFDRVAAGGRELMLVSGYAGVGKTALVAELYKPITGKRGCFISGKFDQLLLNTPYAAFSQAFNQFADLLLTEPEAALKRWREKILAAVGNNGAVLTEVISGLESVIGVQPAVPRLGAQENRNRFSLTFQDFVQAISHAEHPLVVFIDDWQWADSASLELLKVLLTSETISHLLLLGAYRDNEVDQTHPFMVAVNDLTATGAMARTIVLDNLRLEDVRQLVQESLACSAAESEALTLLVHAKTLGNAFFVRQFLQNLYEERWLRFDFDAHRWTWDLTQIETLNFTNNVADLMAAKLKRLPPGTGRLLQLAACIGSEFDLRTLALISEKSEPTIMAELAEPLIQGLVIPLDDHYKLPDTADRAHLSFLHDRVQQAAYSLIPEAQRQPTHLHIARLLLTNPAEEEREDKLFEIVNHFNQGLELLVEPARRREVAELNLRAGQKAKEAAAFRTAWDYFTVARRLLPEDSWQNSYGFTLEVFESSVEAAYLSGEFEAMEELFDVVLQRAQTFLDTVKVHEVIIQALTARTKLQEAVDTGLGFLRSLDIAFPQAPNWNDIHTALQETRSAYQGKGIPELINLPPMTDPAQLAAIRILASISAAAFLSAPELYTLIMLKQVDLSVTYGNTPASAFSYAGYGLILCGAVIEIDAGYQFGRLALDLLERLEDKGWQCRVPAVVHSFITHWKQSVRDSLVPLMSTYHNGLENGDFQFAGYSAILYVAFSFLAGIDKELSDLQREALSLNRSASQMKQMSICQYFAIFLQGLHDLREGRTSRYLKGEYYDEEKMMPCHIRDKDWNSIYYVHFHKLILDYLFGNYREAVADASRLEPYTTHARSFPYGPIFCLFDSLSRMAAFRENPADNADELRLRIEANLEKLKTWAHYAPMNCRHKIDLVEAERQRTFGEPWLAGEAYDRAIAEAKENDYLRDEAIANELAGRFYLDRGKTNIARIYMQEAYSCYALWGATAKLRQMEQELSRLLTLDHGFHGRPAGLKTGENLSAPPAGAPLDLLTVIKASQTMAGEIELEPLLRQMMRIVIENAGAQSGALLLEREGRLVIEAQGEADSQKIMVLQGLDLMASPTVSAEIVHYVNRTRTSVVLNDAANEGLFVRDPSIRQRGVKSVICTPLVNQGRLSGILYLENNLASHAFTPERLDLLNLVSTQMALSLDNARLYSSLEASERRFRTLAEASFEGLILSRDGVAIDVNDQMARMTGYSREEFLGRQVLDAVVPEYRGLVAESMKSRRLAPYEFLVRRKDGTIFPVECRARHVLIGDHEIRMAAIRDITERKRAEETLRESQEFLSSILENIPNMIFIKDAKELRFMRFNRAGEQLLGYRREDLIGKNDYDFFPKAQADFFTGKDREVLASGQLCDIAEEPIETKTGRRLIHTKKLPIMDKNGNPAYLLGISEDITERKHAEEERAKLQAQLGQAHKMESVGRLAGGVAHDFNNMLTGILGHAELALLSCHPSERIHADLKAIEKATLRSAELVQQLLAFARKQTVAPKVLVLNDTVDGMFKMLQRLIGEDINFAWLPGVDLWSVNIDPSQIDQILVNLCVNARDAISGVGRITIETANAVFDETCRASHPEFIPGEYVMLAVSDDGCGMDKDQLDRIFEPFFTTKEAGRGTGLGLSTVYGIVKQNGGFIYVYSEPGGGSTFKVYLPRFEGEIVERTTEMTAEMPRGRGETVLLVEDDAVLLIIGRELLESLGYRVLSASTPGEALRHVQGHAEEIQLLITDVVMPEMNGRDLANLLTSLKPGLKCLFASGYTADVIAHRGVLDEGVHFLQKPFSLEQLAVRVRQAMEG